MSKVRAFTCTRREGRGAEKSSRSGRSHALEGRQVSREKSKVRAFTCTRWKGRVQKVQGLGVHIYKSKRSRNEFRDPARIKLARAKFTRS